MFECFMWLTCFFDFHIYFWAIDLHWSLANSNGNCSRSLPRMRLTVGRLANASSGADSRIGTKAASITGVSIPCRSHL